ncbi:MAG: hypothetical protein M3401_00510 [Actinomycetota bacterium]|nr:hypothetical protein [Actinomycetota bacterium]
MHGAVGVWDRRNVATSDDVQLATGPQQGRSHLESRPLRLHLCSFEIPTMGFSRLEPRTAALIHARADAVQGSGDASRRTSTMNDDDDLDSGSREDVDDSSAADAAKEDIAAAINVDDDEDPDAPPDKSATVEPVAAEPEPEPDAPPDKSATVEPVAAEPEPEPERTDSIAPPEAEGDVVQEEPADAPPETDPESGGLLGRLRRKLGGG